jgi:hypothetical protein
MKTLAYCAISVAALLFARPSMALTPINGGPVGGTVTVVNNGPGNHTDPHVSGDFAAYTDGAAATRSIRYYRFSTAIDAAVPSVLGATDSLSDISGNNIVFTRAVAGCDSIMVFNVSTRATAEVAPVSCPQRFGASIGSSTVAFIDYTTGSGAISAADLAGGAPTQLSGAGTAQNPEVAPNGNAVVWEQCSTLTSCDVMRSVRSGAAWGAAALVVAAASNPDTDGTTVVYDSSRVGSATGRDLYFQPLGGGAETQLQLAGEQSNSSIYGGVIGFESRTSPVAAADIYIYVIATNTLYQVTNTPTIDDRLNDVTLLSTGEVRIVWASNDGQFGAYNVYARTFRVPLGNPAQMVVDLINKTLTFANQMPLGSALREQLRQVAAALIAGNRALACGLLSLYIVSVNAAPSAVFTDAQKAQLVADANAIKFAIGCP